MTTSSWLIFEMRVRRGSGDYLHFVIVNGHTYIECSRVLYAVFCCGCFLQQFNFRHFKVWWTRWIIFGRYQIIFISSIEITTVRNMLMPIYQWKFNNIKSSMNSLIYIWNIIKSINQYLLHLHQTVWTWKISKTSKINWSNLVNSTCDNV
jgi:hypothetical protein